MVTKNVLAADDEICEPKNHETAISEQGYDEMEMLRSQLMTLTNRVMVLELACREDKRRFTEDMDEAFRRLQYLR